jgi:opacity protein-like surface antigen
MHRDFAAVFVRQKYIAFGLGLLVAGTGTAQAKEGDHWYIAGAVTGSILDKPDQTIANAPTPGSTLRVVNDVNFGWGGQAEIGYAWRFARIEAEIGRTANHSDSYTAVSPITITLPQSGKNTITRYMANAYVEPGRGRWPVSPFLGAGIGAASAHATTFAAPARAPTAPPSQLLDIKDTRFAYQLMGGVSVPMTNRLALTAQYRWLDAGMVRGVDSRGQRATRTLRGSNIDVGLRFNF